MKKAKLLLATLTMSVVLSMTALAGEWKHDSKGWWYRNDDGTYPTSSWVADGKDWYYVDAEGTMQTVPTTRSAVLTPRPRDTATGN